MRTQGHSSFASLGISIICTRTACQCQHSCSLPFSLVLEPGNPNFFTFSFLPCLHPPYEGGLDIPLPDLPCPWPPALVYTRCRWGDAAMIPAPRGSKEPRPQRNQTYLPLYSSSSAGRGADLAIHTMGGGGAGNDAAPTHLALQPFRTLALSSRKQTSLGSWDLSPSVVICPPTPARGSGRPRETAEACNGGLGWGSYPDCPSSTLYMPQCSVSLPK
jgi:hypothetical protein